MNWGAMVSRFLWKKMYLARKTSLLFPIYHSSASSSSRRRRRTNQIKAKIDDTKQNSKCRLCGDRDETINHIISECSKLAQKEYETRHNWVGKVIHWKMCKKFKFDHTNKWYITQPKINPGEWDTNSYGILTYKRII